MTDKSGHVGIEIKQFKKTKRKKWKVYKNNGIWNVIQIKFNKEKKKPNHIKSNDTYAVHFFYVCKWSTYKMHTYAKHCIHERKEKNKSNANDDDEERQERGTH